MQDAISEAVGRGWRGQVIVAESRPVYEGRLLAAKFSSMPVEVVFGTDCGVLSELDKVDAVFLGADAVGGGCFINKTGSRAFAATLGPRKKVYVLADTSKYRLGVERLKIPDRPGQEVWPGSPRRIKVMNRYFEKTPLRENMIFINEKGLFRPGEVKKLLKQGKFKTV